MASSAPSVVDLGQKSILYLHAAAQTLLPISQSLSSHLGSNLLSAANDNDVNIPKSFLETRICQHCGSLYLPGVSCTVRTIQSRRQKRKAKHLAWLIYECTVCWNRFRTETEIQKTKPEDGPQSLPSTVGQRVELPKVSSAGTEKNRKRERLRGLKSAIEKTKAEKSVVKLDLLDLMKVD